MGADAELERTVLCPEGELPWVLIRVVVRNRGDATMRRALTEEWAVRQRVVDLELDPPRDRPAQDDPVVLLDAFGGERAGTRSGPLSLAVDLEPGQRHTAWFRFGLAGDTADGVPHSVTYVNPTA